MPLRGPSCKLRLTRISDKLKFQDGPSVAIYDMRYNLEQIENGLLWGNSYYEEYEEIENEIEREEQQKQDLELWLGNFESDVVDASVILNMIFHLK